MHYSVRCLSVGLLVSAFLITSSVFSQATFSELQATETTCQIVDPGKVWVTESGIIQVRGEVRKNRVESSEPRVDGWNYLVVNYNLDTRRNFSGTTQGTFMIVPLTIDGSFQGTFHARIVDGLASGRAVAFGDGELEGQQLSGTIDDFLSNDPGDCQGFGPRPYPWKQTLAVGRILEPNSK